MISVREEIYKKLKNLKNPDEIFSDLFERMIKSQKKDPLKHFGIARDLPDGVLDEFEETVLKAKHEFAENAKEDLRIIGENSMILVDTTVVIDIWRERLNEKSAWNHIPVRLSGYLQ
ncbi:MAG: antitoxin VapB family protein [Promethearchaeia archaeon]